LKKWRLYKKNYAQNKNVPKSRRFVSESVKYRKVGGPNLSPLARISTKIIIPGDEQAKIKHQIFLHQMSDRFEF